MHIQASRFWTEALVRSARYFAEIEGLCVLCHSAQFCSTAVINGIFALKMLTDWMFLIIPVCMELLGLGGVTARATCRLGIEYQVLVHIRFHQSRFTLVEFVVWVAYCVRPTRLLYPALIPFL